jgi:hypothetical protein
LGDVTAKVTNTLDQGAADESIAIGNMRLHYEFDDGRPVSEGDYDEGEVNPTGLWETNCGASEKTCQGHNYRGGHNQCAQGHNFWRNFQARNIHPGTHTVILTGKVWTIDSWDGEHFTVEMKDSQGNVLDTVTRQGNNFASLGDETLSCEGSVGGWQDGFFNIRLESSYDVSKGDIDVRITNTLDQGAGDESIGFGDMRLVYKFDPSVEWVQLPTGDYDDDMGND